MPRLQERHAEPELQVVRLAVPTQAVRREQYAVKCRSGHKRPGHWIRRPGEEWRCARCSAPVPDHTPAARYRIAAAMVALAAYPACAGDTTTTELAVTDTTTTTEARNPEPLDPTALDWEGVARIAQHQAAARAARNKPRPRPTPQPHATPPAGGGDVWARLRQCENGGSYTSKDGDYYRGAYQFKQSTWESLGYTGDPADAPPAVQDEAARRLQARSGWLQWPRCARKLGLA